MTRNEAQAILDGIKDGNFATYGQITSALVATGDYGHVQRGMAAHLRSTGLDQAIQIAFEGTGASGCRCLVARNQGKHCQGAWPGSVANVD